MSVHAVLLMLGLSVVLVSRNSWLREFAGSLAFGGRRTPHLFGLEHLTSHLGVEHRAPVLDHLLHLRDLLVLVVLHVVLHVLVPRLSLPHFLLEGTELLEFGRLELLLQTRDHDVLLLDQVLLLLNDLLLTPVQVLL